MRGSDGFIALISGQGAIARRFEWDGENRLTLIEPTRTARPTSAKHAYRDWRVEARRLIRAVTGQPGHADRPAGTPKTRFHPAGGSVTLCVYVCRSKRELSVDLN